jgi:nucleoside-diphosphate-sugar epimerase
VSKHVLILGGTGLVGAAAAMHFAHQDGCRVTTVSRHTAAPPRGVEHVVVDLDNTAACSDVFGRMNDVTHVLYAAVQEETDLISGWSSANHVERNGRMFRHVLDALVPAAHGLRHVCALQGPKAYGVHVAPVPVPAREDRDEKRDLPNFYWLQEADLRGRQAGKAWHWTILRPVLVIGASAGGSMNFIAALGVFACLARERGEALCFPGRPGLLKQSSDVELIARAVDWAGECGAAAEQVFNIENGETFSFESVWPGIAESFGMRVGPPRPQLLSQALLGQHTAWADLCEREGLVSRSLDHFVGTSAQLADFSLGNGSGGLVAPVVVSSIKIRQAGFSDVLDADTMFKKWIGRYQQQRLLPN